MKTAYELFEEYVADLLSNANCFQTSVGDPSNRDKEWGDRTKGGTPRRGDLWLYVEWEVGGVAGGSCYGGENHGYSTGNAPEELLALDLILSRLKPDISYFQYKLLAGKVVKLGTRSQNEYYGNCTDYAMKKVRVRDLFDYFRDQGWDIAP